MTQVFDYLRERFPLAAVCTLSVGTAVALVSAASNSHVDLRITAITGLVAFAFLCFLLRQRVMDEFKDRGHDDSNYPNRPVQRGAITRRTLIRLGVLALAFEIAAVVAVAILTQSPRSMLAYLTVLAFSFLTAFEFFAPHWLNRHFNIYFASHQLIFLFFWFWAVAIFDRVFTWPLFMGGAAFMLVMAAVEVMRKFEIRKNGAGEIVADTYLAVWGRSASVSFISLSFALAGLLYSLSKSPWVIAAGFLAALVVVLVRDHNKAVQAATFAGFCLIALVAYLS